MVQNQTYKGSDWSPFFITWYLFDMIKQNFNIDSNEVVRILKMHENATKKHYLISEQVKQIQKLEPKTFELPAQTFASGYHSANSLNANQKQQITNVLEQIANYIKQYKGVPMEIQITTGESQPTNFDKENNKKLGSGELANLRGQTITKILEDFFNGLVQKGQLPSMPKIPEFKTEIGKTPRGLDPKHPKYQAEQFIRFSVVSSGEVTSECLVGLKINFVYINEENNTQIPCRGGHFCDEAVFDVYLNKIKVGTANLNNGGCEGSQCNRRSTIEVSSDMVNSIVNSPDFEKKKQLVLWYSCIAQECHASIPEIYIYNKERKQLFPNTNFPSPCVATGAKKGDKGPWALMVLDGCGNPIQMSVQSSTAEMKAIQDEMAADEAEKVRKKQEEDAKIAAEQAALQKQYVDVAQSQGFNIVKNLANTNVFRNSNFKISEQREEGGLYIVNLKNIRRGPSIVKYINDTIQNKVGQFAVPGGLEFILKYPITNLPYSNRKKKFFNDNPWATPVDSEQNYFFTTADVLDDNGKSVKGSKGTVVKLTTE